MVSEIRHARNPFSAFFARLFMGPSLPKNELAESVTLSKLGEIPKQTQMLLAHFLEQCNPDLMLLDNDTDGDWLLENGWFIPLTCPTPGFINLKIKREVWHKLKSLRWQFMIGISRIDLVNYRKQKSALYPWNW